MNENDMKKFYTIIVAASADELEHIEEILNQWHIIYRIEKTGGKNVK